MKTLQDLFLDELADIYDSEARLSRELPRLARAATHYGLTEAFENHVRQTEWHRRKLEKVFEVFGEKPRARRCGATAGLLREGSHIASRNKGEPTINAALISVGQKVNHYEIASYGCLTEWAGMLGNEEAAGLLHGILDEEKAADQELTALARTLCNEAARHGLSSEERAGRLQGG